MARTVVSSVVDCGASIPGEHIAPPVQYNTTYNTSVDLSCESGYVFDDGRMSLAVLCQADGNWTFEAASVCIGEMNCLSPYVPNNTRYVHLNLHQMHFWYVRINRTLGSVDLSGTNSICGITLAMHWSSKLVMSCMYIWHFHSWLPWSIGCRTCWHQSKHVWIHDCEQFSRLHLSHWPRVS